jgi:hypothetical protein
MRSQKGVEPPALKSPVRVVKEAVDNAKAEAEARKELEDLQALWDYDGRTPEERKRYEERLNAE